MSNGPVPPLGNTNVLADKAGCGERLPVGVQPWTVYKPTPPDYSRNKRSDPQPDRALPTAEKHLQPAVRTVPTFSKEVHLANGSQVRIIAAHVDSGVGQLIEALSGSDTSDYRKPLPKKPISQRNRIR